MSKILILKTGNTVQTLLQQGEDFEDWFVAGCGLNRQSFDVVEVFRGARLSEVSSYRGIIVTGSPAFVTDHEQWSEDCVEFLRLAMAENIPLLGICYGHQLLARALGGDVDFHPRGREIGSVQIQLHDAGKKDPLLAILPASFTAQVSHSQTVVRLPDNAVLLAGNAFEHHQAFRVGGNAWGLQFHPEFSERIVRAYIAERRDVLTEEGLDPAQLLELVRPSPHAGSLLQRFAHLALQG
jgi:GMP synthase (glutamine-hydrolysing)